MTKLFVYYKLWKLGGIIKGYGNEIIEGEIPKTNIDIMKLEKKIKEILKFNGAGKWNVCIVNIIKVE